MKVTAYIAEDHLEILDTLFVKGDKVYISPSIRVMDGSMDYGRKVFDQNKNYLGLIRDSSFDEKIEPFLSEITN